MAAPRGCPGLRYSGGGGQGPPGLARAERRSCRAPSPGRQRRRQRQGTAPPHTAPGPLLDCWTRPDPPALPLPCLLPLAPQKTTGRRPRAGAGLAPRCWAERAEPSRRGCSYSAPEGLRPSGATRLGWRRGAHRERRGKPCPRGRERRGTYSGSRCGLGWAALILREGRSWPPARGSGCSAAVRK